MNISILSALIFIAVFAGVVFIHEFGHFIVARLFKVEVEEFGFGLPPRMLTLFHWKGTEFTLNWLPIGGFVRPKGENDPNVPGGLAAASPWTRLGVLLAGPTMNLLLGVVVFSLLFFQMGVPDYTKVQIADVMATSPAAQAGFKINDVVVTANGETINDSTKLHDIIYENLDKPVQFTVLRGKETIRLTATPSSKRPQDQGALGISMGPALVQSGSAIESLQYGSLAVYEQTRLLILLPAQMIRGQISPQDSRFVGLKGIYDLFGQAVSRDVQSREPVTSSSPTAPAPSAPQAPTFFTLQLIGILTISLGVLNLFPFPALDGGRILFIWPELVLRRRIPPQWENGINAAGMALLLVFMVYVNVMDFVNPAIINLPK
jgi:regulator of sigma E protease